MPSRDPNPKPFLAVLMGVAFLSGSCTVQKMLGPMRDSSSDQQLSMLKDAAKDDESAARLVAASQEMLSEQIRVSERYHPYAMAFGLALVTLYSFAFVFGLRAYGFLHGAVGPLSKVAVWVLPARVAVAAVDIASAKALEPATRALAVAFAQAQKSEVPPDQAEVVAKLVGDAAPWFTLSVEVVSALTVCVLFHFAWRYFQRPAIVAYFDRMAGPKPEE